MFDNYHNHDGVNSPKIEARNLKGFQIVKSESALTRNATEGTIMLRWKTTDNSYYLTAFVNGGWREVEIT